MTEQYEYKGYSIEIHQDEDPGSPREWDNLGTMVCWHSRYNLGDEQPKYSPEEHLRQWANKYTDFENVDCYSEKFDHLENLTVDESLEIIEKHNVVLSLYLYDHSGLTMNTTGFSCPWDSGQVGFVFVSFEKLLKEFSRKHMSKKLKEKAEDTLRGEVKDYDQYLTGEVYGYVIKDSDNEDENEEIESCWGFYGFDYCKQEAERIVNYIIENKIQKLEELLNAKENSMPGMQVS